MLFGCGSANLKLQRRTEALDQAQKNLNEAIEKYGEDSPEAKDAADKLAIAQEAAYELALNR